MDAAHPETGRLDQDPPRYDAASLTKGGQVAQITLNDMTYTLRITRTGKLILTK